MTQEELQQKAEAEAIALTERELSAIDAKEFQQKAYRGTFFRGARTGYIAGASAQMAKGWIPVSKSLPDLLPGKDYSANVFAAVGGELFVMRLAYVNGQDENGKDLSGFVWCNCYSNIDGDGEHDDDYQPTHWHPFPKLP